jgi:hypothetical protein
MLHSIIILAENYQMPLPSGPFVVPLYLTQTITHMWYTSDRSGKQYLSYKISVSYKWLHFKLSLTLQTDMFL